MRPDPRCPCRRRHVTSAAAIPSDLARGRGCPPAMESLAERGRSSGSRPPAAATASSARRAAALPAPGAHQPAAAALVLAVVGAQPGAVPAVVGALARVVRVAVRRAPAPEVAAPALAAPAVEPVGAGSTAPEGAERLQALAGGAALHAPRGPRGPAGASRGGRLHRFYYYARRAGPVPEAFVLLPPRNCARAARPACGALPREAAGAWHSASPPAPDAVRVSGPAAGSV